MEESAYELKSSSSSRPTKPVFHSHSPGKSPTPAKRSRQRNTGFADQQPEFTPTAPPADEASVLLLRLRRPPAINSTSAGRRLRPIWGFHLTRTKWDPYPWVCAVDVGTPATVSGLRAGDCILEVNGVDVLGQRIVDIAAIIDAMEQQAEMMTLLVWRSGNHGAAAAANSKCTPESICCGPMPRVLQRLSAIVQSVLSLIECPVCMHTITPPALQCQNGHLICVDCRVRATCCPVCRGFYTPQRARIAEQVLAAIANGAALSDGRRAGRNSKDGDNKLRQRLFGGGCGQAKAQGASADDGGGRPTVRRPLTVTVTNGGRPAQPEVLPANNVPTTTNQLNSSAATTPAATTSNGSDDTDACHAGWSAATPPAPPINDVVDVATNDEAIDAAMLAVNRNARHFSRSASDLKQMETMMMMMMATAGEEDAALATATACAVPSLLPAHSPPPLAADKRRPKWRSLGSASGSPQPPVESSASEVLSAASSSTLSCSSSGVFSVASSSSLALAADDKWTQAQGANDAVEGVAYPETERPATTPPAGQEQATVACLRGSTIERHAAAHRLRSISLPTAPADLPPTASLLADYAIPAATANTPTSLPPLKSPESMTALHIRLAQPQKGTTENADKSEAPAANRFIEMKTVAPATPC